MKISGGFWLIQHLFDAEANGTGGHFPLEFIADPMGVLRRIYAFLEMELTPDVEQAMQEWTRVNRSGKHGNHVYTAEQFGLSAAQIRDDYADYIRHYDVAIEN